MRPAGWGGHPGGWHHARSRSIIAAHGPRLANRDPDHRDGGAAGRDPHTAVRSAGTDRRMHLAQRPCRRPRWWRERHGQCERAGSCPGGGKGASTPRQKFPTRRAAGLLQRRGVGPHRLGTVRTEPRRLSPSVGASPSTSISTRLAGSPNLAALTSGFPALEPFLLGIAEATRIPLADRSPAYAKFRPRQLRSSRYPGDPPRRRLRRSGCEPAFCPHSCRYARQGFGGRTHAVGDPDDSHRLGRVQRRIPKRLSSGET